jgi:hypothetical protein
MSLLLYRPIKKFIFVSRVRRAERKLNRAATEEEKKEIEKRSIPVTVFIVVTFSFVFNRVLIGKTFF